MSRATPTTRLPPAAVSCFESVAAKGWDDDVPLDELLARVNRVTSKLPPAGNAGDSRVSPTLVARTFRHYVTTGCIDPGRRVGRRTVYGYRHFLQTLLVRRLLVDGVPSRRMPELITGSSDAELEGMILGGVEVVGRPGAGEDESPSDQAGSAGHGAAESWIRIPVVSGIELHLREDLRGLRPAELRKLACRVAELMRLYCS